MSDKTWCPGCDSLTSSLNAPFAGCDDCPYCGLSWQAWKEVLDVVKHRDNDAMAQEFRELRIKVDRLEAEVTIKNTQLQSIKDGLKGIAG